MSSGEIGRLVRQVPTQHPFALVDRILGLDGGGRLVATKNVTGSEDFFAGHFPGRPVMPGVLILEALAQAAGIWLLKTAPDPRSVEIRVVGFDATKFRRPVVPGDQLHLELKLVHRRGDLVRFRGEVHVGASRAAEARLLLQVAMLPAPAVDPLARVGNVLGEVGKGHKIAFNVLNIGRFKLGAVVTGAAKVAFAEGARYANARRQFGVPIATFGAIREKIADGLADIFRAESIVYRVAGLLDRRLASIEKGTSNYYEAYQKGIEEYAVECAIAKVYCSEAFGRIADEALQIHGGYGYIKEYQLERYVRDLRVHQILEGTNEIMRVIIARHLL